MPSLAVLGATGYTGRLVVAECLRRGLSPRLLGRDVSALRSLDEASRRQERGLREGAGDGRDGAQASEPGLAAVDLDTPLDLARVDVSDPAELRRALAEVDLLLTLVGPYDRLGRAVLDAAIEAGTDHVDVSGEQPFLRWVVEDREVALREAGVVAVPSAGFEFLPGDLLAALAAGAVSWPREVHVAYTVPKAARRIASAGTRRTIATLVDHPGVALERGELVVERPFEARRLAWFPRPVGPQHAAGIPGGEPLTVPRHVPGVATVRTYLAMPTWRAEFAQMGASMARWRPVRRGVDALLSRGPEGPSAAERERTRWGCVAEAAGDEGVARAWAYGHDLYGLTARSMVAVAERLLTERPEPGVRSPAELGDPGELLDVLAARSDLRWSVARPDPGSGPSTDPAAADN